MIVHLSNGVCVYDDIHLMECVSVIVHPSNGAFIHLIIFIVKSCFIV